MRHRLLVAGLAGALLALDACDTPVETTADAGAADSARRDGPANDKTADDAATADGSRADGNQADLARADGAAVDAQGVDRPAGDHLAADLTSPDGAAADALVADTTGSDSARGDLLHDGAVTDAQLLELHGSMRLGRGPNAGVAFVVVIELNDGHGATVSGATIELRLSAGQAGAPVEAPAGHYTVEILAAEADPDEIQVTVEARLGLQQLAWQETALRLQTVDARWGVPKKVRGLVNTRGWEDGAAISPDGAWLFIQYLPVSPSCLLEGDDDACATARGDWAAPGRPGMPGAERIDTDGHITHACPAWGLDAATAALYGLKLPPNAVYGFHRQADGSFAAPFVLRFDNVDGCVYYGGVSVGPQRGAQATLAFFWDDPRDFGEGDASQDVLFLDATLGAEIVLGRLVFSGDIRTSTFEDFLPQRLGGEPLPGVQSNPHLVLGPDGAIAQLWADRHDPSVVQRDLYVQQLQPGGAAPLGPWRDETDLPSPLSTPAEEIQPFFDGRRAYLTRDNTIISFAFTGAQLADVTRAEVWSDERVELAGDPARALDSGKIFAIGEPTIAVVSGRAELYFIYAIRRDDGMLDLEVGVVEEASP